MGLLRAVRYIAYAISRKKKYIGEVSKSKNDISARYRREASISRRNIIAKHRLYVRYIAEISSIHRKNKERYSPIIVCITFAQYCSPQ